MPSVSEAKLKELTDAAAAAQAAATEEQKRKDAAQQRVRQFDGILDKIVRAAQGMPLIEDRNNLGGYARGNNYMAADSHRCQPLTTEEVQAMEIRSLTERIISLESRLAAVVAVSTFAKEHKS